MLNEDLEIYQGDDYVVTVTVKNADGTAYPLTGFTAKAQVRRTPADSGPVVAEFGAQVQAPNIVVLTLTNAQTLAMSGTYFWDVQIQSGAGAVTTLAKGRVLAAPEITRAGALAGMVAV
jgi:hypothetical protein